MNVGQVGQAVAAGAPRPTRVVSRIGLAFGPIVALAIYLLLPEQYADATGNVVAFTHAGRATLAILVWMAVWWISEAVEIEVTALLPLVAFPLFGVRSVAATAAPYASDVVFLFLGGFVLALAINRWGLDRRIAFLTLRLVGTTPARLAAGMLAATALCSMWVSNTAAAAMMVPIALAVVNLVLERRTGKGLVPGQPIAVAGRDERNFALSLVLSIAYGASIGGAATLIGSPPNGIAARFIEQTYGIEVTFVDWLAIGLPLTLLFLPVTWFVLTQVVYPSKLGPIEGGREYLDQQFRALGRLTTGEKVTLAVFAVTVSLWVTRPWLAAIQISGVAPLAGLGDSMIAVGAAIALFLLPVDRSRGIRAMDWQHAIKLPWGVLLLFGGGLTLAGAVDANGVTGFFASQAAHLHGLSPLVVVLTVVTFSIFATEMTSNTALVSLLLPILAAVASALEVPAQLLLIPCALAASFAFMMPVATPPNAIVFGTGLVTIPQMCKAGLVLNVIGVALVTLMAYFVIVPLIAMR
jgi:solute carrier family 13 (sodium-dependent dicarboxylate transporter), member 2/3/5